VAGNTRSTDFPTVNPVQGVNNGSYDGFVAKIGPAPLPVPAVMLTITPDANTVVPGSSYGYTVTATNTTTASQCFQYWENVTLPGGSDYPGVGSELFGPLDVCLNAGASTTTHLAHATPLTTPLGTYTLNAYVGAYLFPGFHAPVDEAHPAFDVVAGP